MILYFIISAILCIRLGKNLFNIIHKTKKNTAIPYQKAILILVNDQILPHTFWNYIFINKNDYENKKIEKELFTHELTHVTQKHTLDIILLELLHAIFWINPFFILLKKAVQLNHEFLADERVIHQHKNTIQYQHLLVNKAAWKNEYYLASNLNYSLTKKRLKMMTTQSSHTKILIKKLAVIPLLAGFVYLFAERVEAQEIIEVKEYIDSPVNNLPIENLDTEDLRAKLKDINNLKISYLDKDTIIEKSEASAKQMNEYKMLLNEGKKHNIYKLKNIKKMQDIYSLMSEKQKKTVQNISEKIPPPPPPKINNSSQQSFKDIKLDDVKKLRAKINSTINVYNRKNKYYEELRLEKPHFVKSTKERQKQLEKLFSELGSLYFKLSKEDKGKAKRPIHPYDPYLKLRKNNKVFYKLRSELTEEDRLLIPPPPPVPDASVEEILKAKNAYKEWKKRTGNDFAPLPPPKLKKKTVVENKATKTIVILVSKNGKYSISYNKSFKNFKPVTTTTIDNTISKLNNYEIKNTFVFTKTKDLKKFRTKPSNSAEYHDDLELYIMKSNIKYVYVKDEKD